MENSRKNYRQAWGNEIAARFRRAWSGTLSSEEFNGLFQPALLFHFHDTEIHGIDGYRHFIGEARALTENLDLIEELTLSHGDKVLLFFRWASSRWHPDIMGGNAKSNYCKVVLRVQDGRIAELWQQSPDFLFLFGKRPAHGVMRYPDVVEGNLLVEEDDGIFPTDEPQAQLMRGLFQRMNDCFMNRSSLRYMKDIQHEDIVYDTGGTQGSGVQSWKTFAYGLHTCLGKEQGTRFEDLYLRQGDRMRVFLRATTGQASPCILQCAEGLIAAMRLTACDGKIKALETQLENYIQFLDTDFPNHPERLKRLFQGQMVPVTEAPADRPLYPKVQTAAAPSMGAALPRCPDRVAIVGMAGRFPKCDSVSSFWEALKSGSSLISEIPHDRENIRQGTDIRHAGFIDEFDLFDAAYFQMLPAEAQYIDPQQRLMLQQIVHAIEDSGHKSADFSGPRTGLFVATLCEDYQKLLQEQGQASTPQAWSGNENAMFPAKLARFLNIQGACQFVNAECTSSLVAIHEASRLIREGKLDQAIVGASNLLLHPYGFVVRRNALLTDEPVARLFGKNSRGQLRGEAVVVVVLKSLAKAIADGDRIHGLVAGSAVNNSGRTLSLVAGSVEQQARVIKDAWHEAGVQSSDISLIECHASGVRGGDFAEVAAIKLALSAQSDAGKTLSPCMLATAKGAIGHAEAASGLTSIVKTLLQLRHGQIVGIHGLEKPDPELRIDPSVLDLVKEDVAWQPVTKLGKVAPRIAGINGFAAGGYNAHVVIEEYLSPGDYSDPRARADSIGPDGLISVVVLSAQSESSLTTRLADLSNYLRLRPAVNFADLAFSLQRRDAMRHRAAFVVASVEELSSSLQNVAAGKAIAANTFFGRNTKVHAALIDPMPKPALVDGLRIAQQWCEGQVVPWSRLWSTRGRRLLDDLPLYPFEKKRYWLPEKVERVTDDWHCSTLHPLLHENVSTLSCQRYRSVFDRKIATLGEHCVQGLPVLPGVAYLEMVRAAVCNALSVEPVQDSTRQSICVKLGNVVWLQPISLRNGETDSVEVQVELSSLVQTFDHSVDERASTSAPLLAFEVFTIDAGQRRLHCQGQAKAQALPDDESGVIDIDALRAVCGEASFEGAQIYSAYDAMGIEYGFSYRAVSALTRGRDSSGNLQVLAELMLPESARAHGVFWLHPSMADAAVHAAIGLVLQGADSGVVGKPPLPFALESVEILRPTVMRMWAWVRQSPRQDHDDDGSEAGSRVQKLDIDLFDPQGRVCMRIQRLSTRTGDKQLHRIQNDRPAAASTMVRNESHAIRDRVLALLTDKVATILQVASSDVDPQQELSEYGFDSINLTELGGQLNEALQLPLDRPLNPTIFFEHPTLASFANYLVRAYRSEIEAIYSYAASSSMPVLPKSDTAQPNVGINQRASAVKSSSRRHATAEADVAIVGISGRFPMASDIEDFWDNLASDRDCISEVPLDRWDWRAHYGNPQKEPNKTDVKWGGFIDGVGEFDPLFFGISPREAELMDPQQRLLMQHVWQAIEDAGYDPRSLSGSRTGVFLATANSGYAGLLTQANVPIEGSTITGVVPSVGPNRISYFLNLHGPSEPVETACSSSLVAVHRAIAAMRTGACDMAIVGGVNTVVSPEGHIGFRKAGMLCEDGRCKAFSKQANGYVRGEGIGVLFLKKIDDAERACDPIYAVIKGSAVNHGGRANSLTAPNPNAQADLLKAAYTQAGIDPRSVGYIEAHGTGTELGDPIEINGLKNAFHELYLATGDAQVTAAHCGLGSVKSNIGHLELAAGVAGVIKVLMQFKHARLASSLHSQEINPYIQLDGSPFYVVQQGSEWIAPQDATGGVLPRRAGVSSFGFGGVNAHVVLEDYRYSPPQKTDVVTADPCVVVLSARTSPQLQRTAAQLLHALNRPDYRGHVFVESDLRDIAYTLQVGRAAMDERLGIVVSSLSELRAKLQSFAEGAERIADIYRGSEKSGRDALAIFRDDDEIDSAVASWMTRGKVGKVLELWVKGLSVDWSMLYVTSSTQPRRVHLPAYSFSREHYWVPANAGAGQTETPATLLHPLMHRNVSSFAQQRYSTSFNGQEFFLRDHVVMQHRVLPAVVYLEIAHAAICDAIGGLGESQHVRIGNVVWLQPLALDASDDSVAVYVALKPGEAGEIAFQIRTYPEGVHHQHETQSRLHCHGQASVSQVDQQKPLDINRLRSRCDQRVWSMDEVYAAFDTLGLHYGPAHRGIERLHIGESETGGVEVLAKLQLPAVLDPSLRNYVLHPALLDAALQAGIGFILNQGAAAGRPPLPFHLRELQVLAPFTASMWAWVRQATRANGIPTDQSTQSLDIDLCNQDGHVCARVLGFASRALPDARVPAPVSLQAKPSNHADKEASTHLPQSLMLVPSWIPIDGPKAAIIPQGSEVGSMLAINEVPAVTESLRRILPGLSVIDGLRNATEPMLRGVSHLLWVVPTTAHASVTDANLLSEQLHGVIGLFKLVKSLLQQGHGKRVVFWTVITTQGQSFASSEAANPTHAAVQGLLGSMAKELPAWKVRVVDLPHEWVRDGDALLRQALAMPFSPAGATWGWRSEAWHQQKLVPYASTLLMPSDNSAYKLQGVYVVIGGAGGLGEVWSEYMIRNHDARIIWIGRRALDEMIQAKIDRLAGFGARPSYVTADATQRESLQAAFDVIKREFPRIDGVVHSALVLKDQTLANMDEASFRTVLAAKIDVSVCMAQVFHREPLDFVLFFSSLVAFAQPPGQANYAAGCAFKDAFAQQLALEWTCAVKVINWGYWGSIGVAASPEYRQRMSKLGVGSIEAEEAMHALELLLHEPVGRIAFVNVTQPLATLASGLYSSFLSAPPTASDRSGEEKLQLPQVDSNSQLEGYIVAAIKQLLSDALKVDIAAIDIDEPFTDYGLDSITGVHLAQALNDSLNVDLDITLFFDHSTVHRLAAHLLQHHSDAMKKAFSRANGVPVDAVVESETSSASVVVNPVASHRFTPSLMSKKSAEAHDVQTHAAQILDDGIAIVGLSGCFPGAQDVDQLWRNLVEGRDCVGEVPAQRWDWRQVTGDPTQSVDQSCFRWGAFIDGVDEFDAGFFGISPEEATYMSPQQRLLLTHAWKAVEDAAIAPQDLSREPTGVFIATVPSDYLNAMTSRKDVSLMVTGLATSMIPNRISYSLNLRGPSEHCDTACSSTLVALHRAVQAIRRGECRQAIVGAVNLLLAPDGYIGFESMGYLSSVGRMAAFQKEASGFVRAEGVGAVVLKPLRQAIAEGHQIHAVIRGSGVSHGGHAVSMTTPNGAGMREAIRQAYETSGIDPRTISYVEGHGIASPLGDAIEISALKSEYQRLMSECNHTSMPEVPTVFIGSAKPCLGYAEVASGMVSLVKLIMAMRHETLPGIPRFTQLHDNISLKQGPFRITSQNQPWPALLDATGRTLPRRAAINNFGFSGVNAHLVLEQYLPQKVEPAEDPSQVQLFVLSARSPDALRKSAGQMLEFVTNHETIRLCDVAHTLQKGRDAMAHRLAICANGREELIEALQRFVEGRLDHHVSETGTVIHVGVAARRSSVSNHPLGMEQWLLQRRVHSLAEYWVTGGDIAWHRLETGTNLRLVSLPGHPLESTRYWVPSATGLLPVNRQASKPASRDKRHRNVSPA